MRRTGERKSTTDAGMSFHISNLRFCWCRTGQAAAPAACRKSSAGERDLYWWLRTAITAAFGTGRPSRNGGPIRQQPRPVARREPGGRARNKAGMFFSFRKIMP
jgi:hypothetical protein